MKKSNSNTIDFNIKLHRVGRLWMLAGILLIAAVPIVLALYYKEMPDWTVFGSVAVIIPLLINTGSGIVEPVIYAPMLGTNGEYLAFLTGNLSNLKIPCVVKSQEIVGTKMGTEENEIVSTIAIATSTLVTAVVIGIMVLCLSFSNLQQIIAQNEFIQPAFGCVVYALFGSLGGKYVAKNPKLALFAAVAIAIISAVLGAKVPKFNVGSGYLLIGIVLCILFAVFQYSREKKKLARKEEQRRLAAIAAGISYEKEIEIERIWDGKTIAEAAINKDDLTSAENPQTSDTAFSPDQSVFEDEAEKVAADNGSEDK